MPESDAQKERPSTLELDIIRSFGWTLVDYEETLYQKFLLLSANSSLVSIDDFRLGLRSMEAKGYVSSMYLGDRKAYKKLLVQDDVPESITPQFPLDEIRLALGSIKAGAKTGKDKARKRRVRTDKRERRIMPTEPMPKDSAETPRERILWGVEPERSQRVTKDLVNESSTIGQELLDTVQQWVQEKYGTGMRARMVLRSYIENMCHALGESEEVFIDYVREETPDFLPRIQDIINTHGSDFLLLSLRLV
ncbi:MAG: hypothetical protein ACTSV2_05600 [Candidatus Thorarchaeota archaeon]